MPSGKLSQNQPGGIPANSGIPYTDTDDLDVSFSRDGSRMVAELQHSVPATEWSAVGDTMVWDLADPSRASVQGPAARRSPSRR